MKRNELLIIAAALLFLLGIILIYLGSKTGILPPVLSGVAFLITGIGFWALGKKE